VRAGLAVFQDISTLNEQIDGHELSARVGIHSGAVVVGRGAGKQIDVFGEVPNIAARVQSAAYPGEVMLTAETQRLISGLFVFEDRGPEILKGLDRPIQLYRVKEVTGARSRLEAAAASRGLTRFIGREEEVRVLLNRWDRACHGHGQVALILGEPGIGKSRLLRHFRHLIVGTPHIWIESAAGALFQNTPFYPVTDILRRAFRFDAGGKRPLDHLAESLAREGLNPATAIPLLAPLLNVNLTPEYQPLAVPPEEHRRRLKDVLVSWALRTARVQPLVIATEDLHWADASTLELVRLLVEQGTDVPLLLLYTARPEFHFAWPLRAHHSQLMLNRLGPDDARLMIGEVAAQKTLPAGDYQ
jgi:hypothetical protein